MADRVIEYVFKGKTSDLTSKVTAAGKSVSAFGDQLTAADAKGAKWRSGLTELGGTAGKVGLLAAAGFTAFVGSAANFDQAMSSVSAATHETAANMTLLRQAAMDAGADTSYSAGEAAGAIEELAKAGVSTKDILAGGLIGSLNLAAAGELEVGTAAELAATAMTQFKLSGDQVTHVADLLAAGAGKAQGGVTDLGGALKQSGLVASQLGISIEETVGTLAAFASAGLIGSDAGTSFRTMLLRLANPTKESADLMRQLGINAYDAQGNFVGMASIAGQLQTAFAGMTQAQRDQMMATLFGSDAIRAANVLYNEGADGLAHWTGEVNEAGYAAETAAQRTDNLMGDLERLGGALETALISGGEGAQGPLRETVQLLTDVVDGYAKLPKPVQNAGTAVLGLTAALGGTLFVGSKVVTGLANTRKAMSDLGIAAGPAGSKLGRIASAAGRLGATAGAILGVVTLVNQLTDSIGRIDAANLDRVIEAFAGGADLGKLSDSFHLARDDIGQLLADMDRIDRQHYDFDPLGPIWNTKSDKALDNIEAIDQALAALVETGDEGTATAEAFVQRLQEMADASGLDIKVVDQLDAYTLAQENAGRAAEDSTGPNADAADAIGGVGDQAGTAADQLLDLVDAMKEQTDQALGAFDANIAYGEALSGARESLKENGAEIRNSTEAGRENNKALSDLAGAWNNMDDTVRNGAGNYERARRHFIDLAVGMGYPREEARRMAEEFLNIPDRLNPEIQLQGAQQAEAEMEKLTTALDKVPDSEVTNLRVDAETGIVTLHGEKIAQIPKSELTRLRVDPETGKITLHNREIGRVPKSAMTDLRVDPETRKVTLHGIEIGKLSKSELTYLKVDAETGKVTGFKREVESVPSQKTTVLTTIRRVLGKAIPGNAEGGLIGGPRWPYGDKVLVGAAPGEYMVSNRRGQVDKNLAALQAANAGAKIAVVGYAEGGQVLRGIPGYAAGGRVDPYDRLTGGAAVGYDASRGIAARYRIEIPRDLLYGLTNLSGVLSKTKDTVATDTRTRKDALEQARRDARAKSGPGGAKVTAGERSRIDRLTRELGQAENAGRRSVNRLTRGIQAAERQTQTRLDAFTRALDLAKDALERENRARQELVSSIGAGLKSDLWADLEQTVVKQTVVKQTGSVFARATHAWESEQTSRTATAADVNARLRKDIAEAAEFTRLEKQLRNRGLNGAALNELIAAGDVARLRAFAAGTNAELRTYQSLYGQRDQAAARAGNTAADAMGITAAQKQTTKEVQTLTSTVRSLQRQLDAAEKAREKAGKAREQARARQQPKNAAATGRAVAAANNKTAKNAKKR